MARELDDAILSLRTNELEIGTWLLRPLAMLAPCWPAMRRLLRIRDALVRARDDRHAASHARASRRVLAHAVRADRAWLVFRRHAAELTFAADRSYMLALPDEPMRAPTLTLSELNFGAYPMVNGQSRLSTPLLRRARAARGAREAIGKPLAADEALALGLVTSAPDDIDWADELRIALEERASLSPDALTGMEANLRFGGTETMESRIFGRLTAWQNWIFIRPNAVGEKGALKVYGNGEKAAFDWNRV